MSSKPGVSSRYDDLRKLFQDHASNVRALQRRASEEIVPDVQVHERLDEDEVDWIEDYLKDGATVFRIFKRQKFITSFTHESLRKAVLWRLEHLKPIISQQGHIQNASIYPPLLPASAIQFLDRGVRDGFGRPIAILRVSHLNFKSGLENLKRDILLTLEWMRVILQQVNSREHRTPSLGLVLEYVVVVDLKDISITTIPVELVSWYLKEVQPWYNGVVGSALIVNYTWAHSGLWRILKLLLPASMIAKVGFPSNDELAEMLPDAGIKSIFTGNTDQTLNPNAGSKESASTFLPTPPSTRPHSPVQMQRPRSRASNAPDTNTAEQLTEELPMRSGSLLRFSSINPYFGYPILPEALHNIPSYIRASFSDSLSSLPSCISGVSQCPSPPTAIGTPVLRHGRRRKRDLARTLLVMYWQRWGDRAVVFGVILLALNILMRISGRSRSSVLGSVRLWMSSRKLLTRALAVLGAGAATKLIGG